MSEMTPEIVGRMRARLRNGDYDAPSGLTPLHGNYLSMLLDEWEKQQQRIKELERYKTALEWIESRLNEAEKDEPDDWSSLALTKNAWTDDRFDVMEGTSLGKGDSVLEAIEAAIKEKG